MYKFKLSFFFIAFYLTCNSQEYNPNATYSGTETDPCKIPATTWYLGGNIIAPQLINMPPPPPDAPVSANNPIYNDIGTCNNYDFVLKANNNLTMWIKPSTKVGISVANPMAKFEVLETNPLSLEQGGLYASLISSFRGRCLGPNDIKHNNWMYRVTPNQPNGSWEDYGLHDGVSIDGSHNLPGSTTRTWWERLPGEAMQKWGDQASTFLKIAPNFMQIMEQPNALNTAVLNLNVNGGNAFEIFDQANQKVNFKVKANGFVFAREINVMASHIIFPDYVFDKNYKLKSLKSLESFINENKHLPNIPSAKEVAENGINLAELQVKQMEKIEELYLYLIQQQKEIEKLKQQNCKLEMLIKKH